MSEHATNQPPDGNSKKHVAHPVGDLNPEPNGYRKGNQARKYLAELDDLLYSEGMGFDNFHLSLGPQNGD